VRRLPEKIKWFPILAPKEFGGKEIGEAAVKDPKTLLGRRITVNVADLTGDPTRYYMKLTFRVNDYAAGKAMTSFDAFDLFRDYIARMVLKHTTRLDLVQNLVTRDGKKVRVKSVCILPKDVKTSIAKRVGKEVVNLIKEGVEATTLDRFVKATIAGEIKTKVVRQAGKVYPIKDFEIRRVELLS